MQVIRKLNNYTQINIISPSLEICSSATGKICCSNLQYGAYHPSGLTAHLAFYQAPNGFRTYSMWDQSERGMDSRGRSPGTESQISCLKFILAEQSLNHLAIPQKHLTFWTCKIGIIWTTLVLPYIELKYIVVPLTV